MTEIMTYREFEKEIEDWGNNWGIETKVKVGEAWTEIYAKKGDQIPDLVAIIHNEKLCIFDLAHTGTMDLEDAEKQTLFRIVTKFASTWPADRKYKEKKYRITFDFDADADWSAEDVEILVKESLSTVYPFRKFMQYLKVEEKDA